MSLPLEYRQGAEPVFRPRLPDSRPLVHNRAGWIAELARTGFRRSIQRGPSVGYIGWTSAGNLGDTAMLEAARLLFRDEPVEVFTGARREAALGRLGLSGKAAFSRIYLGGGTLINAGYLGVVERALAFDVPVSTLGTGAGSADFSSSAEEVPPGWAGMLRRFRKVGVRGPLSLEKLKSIGVANGEIIGDLALALTLDAPVRRPDRPRFIVNAASPGKPCPGFPAEAVLKELTRAVRRLAELGWRPMAVAFAPEDVEPTARVLREAGVTGVKIECPSRAGQFFALAEGASFSLGVRLHCAVLSCCAGLAPLGIAYREKGHDFAASMDLSDWMADAGRLRADVLTERALALAECSESAGAAAHAAALKWREKIRSYAADA